MSSATDWNAALDRLRANVCDLQRSMDELQARSPHPLPELLKCGEVSMDTGRHEVRVDGLPTRLAPKEFEVLKLLLREPGRVWSKAALLDLVWGSSHTGYFPMLVKRICRLRRKLGRGGARLEAVYGVGYRFRGGPAEEEVIR